MCGCFRPLSKRRKSVSAATPEFPEKPLVLAPGRVLVLGHAKLMSFLLRSATLIALCSAAILLSLPGCSEQAEGERCELAKNGNADCDSSLICVSANELRDGSTDRCCPADLVGADPRCDRKTGSTGSGGTSGGGGGTGKGGAGGTTPAGGMSGASGENFGGNFEIDTDGAGAPNAGAPSAGAPASQAGANSGGAG